MAYMLEEDGMAREDAGRVAAVMARHPEVLLKTMVEKELGVSVDVGQASPLTGALVMGVAFGLGAIIPIIPHLLLPVPSSVYTSVVATALVLFGIGAAKSRWTGRSPIRSGLEILVIGAVAGIVGYFFGDILPTLLGAPAVG
jgi:VIT1/CCC1 family predicted Fe2+/Mn2+ transporter